MLLHFEPNLFKFNLQGIFIDLFLKSRTEFIMDPIRAPDYSFCKLVNFHLVNLVNLVNPVQKSSIEEFGGRCRASLFVPGFGAQLPVAQFEDPVHHAGDCLRMRDDDKRHVLLSVQLEHETGKVFGAFPAQRARRLVGQ